MQKGSNFRTTRSPYVGVGRLTLLQLMALLAVVGIVVTLMLRYFFSS